MMLRLSGPYYNLIDPKTSSPIRTWKRLVLWRCRTLKLREMIAIPHKIPRMSSLRAGFRTRGCGHHFEGFNYFGEQFRRDPYHHLSILNAGKLA
jgi:hypothetical protein